MAIVTGWVTNNWFVFLQAIGIVGGLLFAAMSMRRDTKARRVSDLLALSAQHRQIWGEMQQRPELGRILKQDVDLVAQPISLAEEEYLNAIILHFNTGWRLAQSGALIEKKDLAGDVRSFFALPIPKAIWNRTREGRDSKFIQFVDHAIHAGDRKRER